MITIQANDIEVQLRLLKRKYKRKKRWAGSSPSPAHSPLPCPYDPGDPESPAALTSHQRSHIKQSIVEASAGLGPLLTFTPLYPRSGEGKQLIH